MKPIYYVEQRSFSWSSTKPTLDQVRICWSELVRLTYLQTLICVCLVLACVLPLTTASSVLGIAKPPTCPCIVGHLGPQSLAVTQQPRSTDPPDWSHVELANTILNASSFVRYKPPRLLGVASGPARCVPAYQAAEPQRPRGIAYQIPFAPFCR